MKEFLMIFRHDMDESKIPPAEEMQTIMMHWQTWIKAIAEKGNYTGTNRLLPGGKTLKPNQVITDGPYAEGKEMVGGYLIVKAGSLEEAVEMAKLCPNLIFGGSVEVRSVMQMDANADSKHFLAPK